MKPEEALLYYNIEGAVEEIAPFGLGHINDSFKVNTTTGAFLLQRINTSIFKDVEALESNLRMILFNAPELFPEHIQAHNSVYHVESDNEVWRLQRFVENSTAPTSVDDIEVANQIGYGFGCFTKELIDLDVNLLQEAIPDFHHLGLRIAKFEAAVKTDVMARTDHTSELIAKARAYTWIWDHFLDLVQDGLPRRTCHNDTKSTNILLNVRSNEFLKVIDLDTVGAGYVLFDFGDMIRSIAIQSNEGDREGLNQALQVELIQSVKEGYLNACGTVLTEQELDSLSFGSLFMTYFTGIRMLTDYLEGDIYYRIQEPDDNLVRANNQFYILDLLTTYYKIK